ncbi:hypothetical protein [Hyphomicrobium sp.]|jgi:hypothetical protein|uniref:hypothetical protein n=1 Tax=Hyphomicrobium sp. TaxID=82 RepID=UPI003568089A
MRFSGKFIAAFGLAATIAVATSVSASAECKRYGFLVNDYGKDGPTKDAKDLLDKMIATKMTEKGVSDYSTGKKSVSCELFLNFIVFDEHTCTASATVCWGGSKLPGSEKVSSEDAVEPPKATEAAAEEKPVKKKAVKEAAAHIEAAPIVHKTSAQVVPDPKSVLAQKTKKASEKKEASASSTVETGSLSEPVTKHKSHKTDEVAPVKPSDDGAGYPAPLPPTDGNAAQ